MPRLRDRFPLFWRRRLAPAPPKSDITISRPTSSNSSRLTPTRPESDPKPTQPTSIIPNLPAVPRVPANIEDIRRQIWNEAYDKVKDDEPDTVDAYEKILSAQLAAGDTDPSSDRNTTNVIAENAEARQAQMKTLVGQGLDKTEKEARIKEKFNEGLQPVNNVKDFVSIAVKSEPTAAVAWLGITTLIDLIANPLTQPGINRDGVKYVLERVEWYWELAQLLLDPDKADDSIVGLQSILRRHVIKLYKKLLLYQMQSVCLYNKSWAKVIVRDLFKADDWQDKVDSIKKAEASLRDDVNQHNSEELKSRLRSIDNTLDHLRLDVKAVESAIRDHTQVLRQNHDNKNDKQCLQDLRIVDPEAHKGNIEKTKGGLLKDSYYWILEHDDFRRFRNDPESRLLWIKGDPGKGKTMLLCGIIDHLKQETSQVLSFYFCQATQSELRSAASVLRGLLWLLCDKQRQLTSFVRSKYDSQGKKLFEDGQALKALEGIFEDMLKDPRLQEAVFVVDALDECSDDSRKDLIDFILKASRLSSSKWIVSSRNWPSIEEQFQDSENVRIPLELNKDSISQAVGMFVEYKVEQLARKKKYDPQTKDDVLKKLLLKANDTFLWVALVCKELARPEVKAQDTIAELDSVPEGLDEFYQRMLNQVLTLRDRFRHRYGQILATACLTYRPVSLDELRVLVTEVKGFSDEQLEEIIRECGSFLTLQDGVVYFVHQSAQDFLLDNASDQILPSGTAHQHRALFSRSLGALSETLRRNMYNLSTPGFSIDQVSPPDPDPLSSIRYSCVYWVDHLHDSNSTEKISDNKALQDGGDVHRFIQRRYLYWLECLSLLQTMSEGVNAVHKLEALVRKTEARQLAELLQDARRFVLSHARAIEIAPLQAYASALVFSPEHSLIRELYKKEEPDWIASKPRMEADWNACLQTLEGHGDWVRSVAFSADGERLASGSHDSTVKIWDAATGACVQTLEGHGGWVSSVAFSADGERLASGSDDETVKIWDAATGACVQTLEGHGDWVRSVAFSADGERLASGSHDKTVKIWDAATGACVQTLEGHGHWVSSVAFSADGERLASGSHDETVKIWDAATGACVQTLEGHGGSVSSVAFSADGERLASGSHDSTVKIWDAATGACVQTLEGHGDWVSSVAFSADGERLASGSHDSTVKIWDAATGACVQTLEGHGGSVSSVAFSADGERLASGSHDSTVKIWDAATGACVQTLEGHGVRSVAFSADGERLASGSDDKTVKIWDAATGACVQTLEGHGHWVSSVAFSADGERLASGSDDETVKIWDAATGACVQTLEGHGVRSVAFSADGERLASGSHDKTVKIWDAATGACVQTLEGHGDWVSSVAFSADGERLASGSHDSTVKIWDAATGACVQTLEGHGGSVSSVAFSADGERLASGSHDSTVKIWDAATGACVQTLEGHGGWVSSVAFSADGERLASGSHDSTVKIWDAATGACVQTLEGHGGWVSSVAFSADGERLASGSHDSTVKIWDAATGACVQTLEGHGGWVSSVAFSADGERLASGSDDETVKIWDAATGACVQTLDVGRTLYHLSFDPTTNTLLSTNIGLLNLDHPALPPAIDDWSTAITLRSVRHSGWGISTNGIWIVKDGKEMLWLPPDYRVGESAIVGSTVAVGCHSGRVLVMKFS